VTANDHGTVAIEINALRDAKGLERRLRQAGVPAVVQYLPPGNSCSEEAFTLVGPARLPAAIETSEDGSVRFEIDRDVLRPRKALHLLAGACERAAARFGNRSSAASKR
jgi:hypothetical protein